VTSVAGQRLTERQRRQQLALRAAAVNAIIPLWKLFDIASIDASWAAIEPALLAIITAGRTASAEVAANYYTAIRAVEGVPGRFTPPLLTDTAWQAAAAVSLRVMGPVAAKKAVAANRPNASTIALTQVSGAVSRYVLQGGRETLVQSVQQDSEQNSREIGWARVGSGRTCAFCAMLISRGAVYGERTGDFEAHDHCACTLEPEFSSDAPRTAQAKQYADQWAQADGDVTEFRRIIEGRSDAA
jgi:hypothetical protein